jgi:hypothetical protein
MSVRAGCVRAVWTGLLLAGLTALSAGRAQAIPVYFDGPGGFGISEESAANALDAGVPIIEVDAIVTADSLGLTIPERDVISFTLVTNPSTSNPHRVNSQWTVAKGGPSGVSDAWLVFLNPLDYTPSRVGFEIDGDFGWAVIQVFVPEGEGGSDYFYPAKFLGDMSAAETVDFLMRHRIGQSLRSEGGDFVLPQYSVGALQGVPLPEPASLALGAIALLLAAILRTRSA